MIFIVTKQGRDSWMNVDGSFNHERLIAFVQASVRDGKRRRMKVFRTLDNVVVHRCGPAKTWLDVQETDIEVFNRRRGSPKLNSDGRLNADRKQANGSKVSLRTNAKLRFAANHHMQCIAANAVNRDRIRNYFQDPFVKVAA